MAGRPPGLGAGYVAAVIGNWYCWATSTSRRKSRDVHDPKLWEGQVLFSLPEREAFQQVLDLGLLDSFRLFEQPEKCYTWWDYRMMAFRRNMGLRIDHILLSSELAGVCTACVIDKATRKLGTSF